MNQLQHKQHKQHKQLQHEHNKQLQHEHNKQVKQHEHNKSNPQQQDLHVQKFTEKIKDMLVYPPGKTPSTLIVHDPLNVNILQELIYFFNNTDVRNYLIRHFMSKMEPESGCQYMGTFFVREKDDDSRELLMDKEHHGETLFATLAELLGAKKKYLSQKRKKTLFTLAILYKVASIHFVSFMYDPVQRRLVTFDPGNNLYHNGSRVLIPNCIDTFVEHNLLPHQDAVTRTGPCKQYYFGRTFGPQYNGEDPDETDLPADAFCQSWSLRFKLNCILNKGDPSFVKKWCDIKPQNREASMVRDFFIPILTEHPWLLAKFKKACGV